MQLILSKFSTMTIQEIFGLVSATDIITNLKKRNTTLPDTAKSDKQWEIKGHDVMDAALRPDKTVTVTNAAGEPTGTRVEFVARVPVPLQKLIVGRAAAFAFGNPPNITSNAIEEQGKTVYAAVLKILTDNKSISHNKRIAKDVMRYTEAAECWFPIEEKNTRYGFESAVKIRCRVFSARNGDTLYPLFDEYGDLIAFSREYMLKENDVDVQYFEAFTKDVIRKWKFESGAYVEVANVANVLGKIPVVYVRQEETEWADAQLLINRLEKLLSNFADTNDYHGSPKIFIQGTIKGFSKKGESGSIIEGDKDSTAQYLSWDHAPESVKLETDTLLRLIYSVTQTPDISFDAIKGINQISGIALRLLFLDAHLKVEDKKDIYLDMLQRRVNILKAFVGKINTKLAAAAESVDLACDIDPYMPGDMTADITNLMNATGGKAILSQRTAIEKSGMVPDAEAEYKLIQDEDAASNVKDLFNPTA